MKTYPSIPRSTGQAFREFEAYVFDKLDGSNLRFEYTRKKGFYKFGTRRRLFDKTDPIFGAAIASFVETMAEPLTKIARDQRWEKMTVFAEFWGERSLGGQHHPDDEKTLTLFDVDVYRKGFLGPKAFLEHFEGIVETPYFFGVHEWTRDFVEQIRRGDFHENMSLEGVVGKAGSGHNIVRAKAKTQAWIDAILERYGEDGKAIVES